MTHYESGETVRFTAERACTLAGRAFREGDSVDVVLDRSWSDQKGYGQGGPWGYGGYTHYTLRRIAKRITDAQTGRVLLSFPNKVAIADLARAE